MPGGITLHRRVMLFGLLFGSLRMLIGPVSALYLLARGLSLSGIAYLKGLQALIILLVDAPFGYLADRYSYKLSLVAGVVSGGLWLGLTAYSPHVSWLYTGEVFNALSLAFFNGAFEAVLVAASRKEGRREPLDAVFGAYAKYEFLAMAAAAAVGGLGARVDSSFFWWAGAAGLFGLAGASAWLLSGVPRPEPSARGALRSDIAQVWRYLRRQPADLVRLFAVILTLNLYYQIMIQYWQPILAEAGMARRAFFFSAAFIGILLVQSVAGAAAARLGRRLRGYFPLWLGLGASGLAVFGGVWTRGLLLAIAGLLLFFLGYRTSSVLLAADLHARLEDWVRATYPSVLSTALRVGLILLYPLVGWGVNRAGLGAIGLIGLVLGMGLLLTPASRGLGRVSGERSVPGSG
ncbi:MAG: MFS transporter [Firmicutes bacterium]|nr:MFS transporter [Bacillota bacterium]